MRQKAVIFVFLASLFVSLSAYSSNLLTFFIPNTHPSCPHAEPISSSKFCPSFKTSAICNCSVTLPKWACQDMNEIYKQMISFFHTQKDACNWQKDVPPEECMNDWDCYRTGKDSHGNLCPGTSGRACS